MSLIHQNSPKVKRSSSDQNSLPVTPQRINNIQKQIRAVSSPIASGYSSISSSPFSPLTNTYSSPLSVATPSSSVSSATKVNISPEALKMEGDCLADAVNNWRIRAKENGIKVSLNEKTTDGKHFSTRKSIYIHKTLEDLSVTTGDYMLLISLYFYLRHHRCTSTFFSVHATSLACFAFSSEIYRYYGYDDSVSSSHSCPSAT